MPPISPRLTRFLRLDLLSDCAVFDSCAAPLACGVRLTPSPPRDSFVFEFPIVTVSVVWRQSFGSSLRSVRSGWILCSRGHRYRRRYRRCCRRRRRGRRGRGSMVIGKMRQVNFRGPGWELRRRDRSAAYPNPGGCSLVTSIDQVGLSGVYQRRT